MPRLLVGDHSSMIRGRQGCGFSYWLGSRQRRWPRLVDLLVIVPGRKKHVLLPTDAIDAHKADSSKHAHCGIDVAGGHVRVIGPDEAAELLGVPDETAFVVGLKDHARPETMLKVRQPPGLTVLSGLGLEGSDAGHQ